jgi:transcription initiation factor TFIID subunit 7
LDAILSNQSKNQTSIETGKRNQFQHFQETKKWLLTNCQLDVTMASANRGKKKGVSVGERRSKAVKKAQGEPLPLPGPARSFITLKLSPNTLAPFGNTSTQEERELQRELNSKAFEDSGLQSKIAILKFGTKQASAAPILAPDTSLPSPHTAPAETNHDPPQPPEMNTRGAWKSNLANPNREGANHRLDTLYDALPQNKETIASRRKRKRAARYESPEDILKPQAVKRQRKGCNNQTRALSSPATDTVLDESDGNVEATKPSSNPDHHSDKENESGTMADRPKLALKLSFAKPSNANNDGFVKPATPAASSPPAQTPTIKLKVNKQDGSAKKRKRVDDHQGDVPVPTPTSAVPKIKLKTFAQPVGQSPVTPGVKLHTKGKIPKRPLGVGYDSELSDTERDPVILESFVLRMQPGKDCDYLKEHITKGTMGHSKMQGGADVGINVFDDKGRRCCLRIRQNRYAATLVDLPTVSEGMKSWDNKRFIKSSDVCQMMVVLGPVGNQDEAKSYPLTAAIDPKTYQYAHGLTAPMHWVRKRRFERTKRTRVDEIEAIDRRVGQLLAADASHQTAEYHTLNYDPRQEEDLYSASESDDDDDEDADGEEEDYFNQNGEMELEDQDEPGEAELNEFDQLFAGADEDEDMGDSAAPTENGHIVSGTIDSSGFVTSNADSPDLTGSLAPTAAPTPGGDVSTPAAPTPGSDGDNESDDQDQPEDRAAKNEKDEETDQARDRLAALEGKRNQTLAELNAVSSVILKRRLAQKIQEFDKDIAMQKRILNISVDEDDS